MSVHPDQRLSDNVDRVVFTRPMPVAPGSVGDMAEHSMSSENDAGLRPAPALGARLLGAASYLAGLCIVVYIARPGRRFAFRHSRLALTIHMLRLAWLTSILAIWGITAPSTYSMSQLVIDMVILMVSGVPRVGALPPDALPWIIWPLAMTWTASLVGLCLAATGRTADFHAFAHADWSNVLTPWWRRGLTAEEERRQARIARQRQLERLQRTTMMLGVERTRRQRMEEIEAQIHRLEAEREHLAQLLSLGEMSHRRYEVLNADIEEEIATLRVERTDLASRSGRPKRVDGTPRASRLDRVPESEVETVAIVSPSGVPLFTYGSFQIDEALVAGILSAFDSISEEVFGSRVHKTELAEGKVLHFVHGQHVIVLAIFTDEPSPRQIEELRTMLRNFEAANNGPLARQQHDPSRLIEVHPPFHVRQNAE